MKSPGGRAAGIASRVPGRAESLVGQRAAAVISTRVPVRASKLSSTLSPLFRLPSLHHSLNRFQVTHRPARTPLQLSCRLAPRTFSTFAARTLAIAAIGAAAWLGASTAALAQTSPAKRDDTPQADAAIANKDWSAALKELDARIASNPRDAQAKFKRATVLARLNRDDEAIAAFTELTQAYPELPEPYNNLAALYAKKGRYEDARVALETAVKANPGYALAYDNLGDLYLRLASESYKRAQTLGSKSPLTSQRLAAIQNIYTPPPKKRASAAAAASDAAAASGARGATAPRTAADEWAPASGTGGATSTMPAPDAYSPFGGPSGPLPTAPYVAPNAQP
ncbi:TPR repeat-containing protein [Caballeronia ptereochthonis]|uniref:TPR repeat-containing protein n=1 Tax=Caballeronia ptereochthonis TaxID=1777144 RepID=A0A157Z3T8_9BURK|nr:TPR repeat-containing protein [Caballeronia ptereochthonis]